MKSPEPPSPPSWTKFVQRRPRKLKIDKWHHHEIVDRLHVVLSLFDDFVLNHPVTLKDKSLHDDAGVVTDKLCRMLARAASLPGWRKFK